MEGGLSRVKILGCSRHAMGQIYEVWRLQQIASRNEVFAARISWVFEDKLHFKKGEELFHKVSFVAEKLKRELSLERACYVR